MVKTRGEEDSYKVDADKVRAKMKATEGDRRFWKPKPNSKNYIRIFPPWGKGADGSFFYTAGLHYNFQLGGQNKAVPCLRTQTPPSRCLVCEFSEALKNSDDEELQKLSSGVKGIKKRVKYWVNVVDRKYPDQIKMWGTSRQTIEKLEATMDDEDYGDIFDLKEGHDVKVVRTGSTFSDTRYDVTVRPKPSALDFPDWKSKIHKLDQVVIEWMTIAEVAKALRDNYGDEMKSVGFKINLKSDKPTDDDEDEETDEDEDEEETPKKKVKLKVVKKKVEEDDDEEEEEKPKKKVVKKDEDDEEEDEDEDEED